MTRVHVEWIVVKKDKFSRSIAERLDPDTELAYIKVTEHERACCLKANMGLLQARPTEVIFRRWEL